MIQLSVYYPVTEGASFDHDYYRDVHVPMVREAWGLEAATIEKGLHGPHTAAVHVTFESLDAMSAALANSEAIIADVANFTTITSTMQISEVVA